ncbi:MAG TPA: sigma-54 dependent transcriptional regulator [Polyangia bacterium]|jgi:DNA-binding NtrC family response regulator
MPRRRQPEGVSVRSGKGRQHAPAARKTKAKAKTPPARPGAPPVIPEPPAGDWRSIRMLVVDRDPRIAAACAAALSPRGVVVESADSVTAAVAALEAARYDLAVVELALPDGTGLELLAEIRRLSPSTVSIATSSHSTVRSAVQAMKHGAYDFLGKPFSDDVLAESVSEALEKWAFFGGARTGPLDEFHGMVGRSRAMLELRQWVQKTTASHASVLLLGELGTGKELVARVLHDGSPRADGPLVTARCGGAPPAQILAEWFGHLTGGSVSPGAFEMARRGTLFLRDVADVTPELQDALYGVLATRTFTPIGATDPYKLNVRLISATDRNLAGLVADRRFRQDLFYLIASHTMSCPSLRDRREDIPLLVDHFLTRFCRQALHRPIRVTPAAYALLAQHDWPGNVRELECVIEDAALRTTGGVLDVGELRFLELKPVSSPVPTTAAELKGRLRELRSGAVVELERLFVVRALERTHGNVSRAARAVGMQRPNFQSLMRRNGVRPSDYAQGSGEDLDGDAINPAAPGLES